MNLPPEQEMIGTLMLAATDEVGRALQMIHPEYLDDPTARRCYEAIQRLHADEKRPGTDAVADLAGCPEYVATIHANVCSPASLDHYADVILDKYRRRQLEAANAAFANDLMGDADLDTIRETHNRRLNKIPYGRALTVERFDIRNDLDDCLRAVDEARKNGGIIGTPTGFPGLDDLTGGLRRGDLSLIAAQTSAGKTTLLMNIVTAAIMAGRNVVAFSLEMKRGDIVHRIASSISGVTATRLARGNASPAEKIDFVAGLSQIENAPGTLYLHDDIRSVAGAAAFVRSAQGINNIDLVAFDYLQLAASSERGENRCAEVTSVSEKLKLMAMELDVPVLAASQLNRDGVDTRPRLKHLRDSGALEQDAAVVAFLYHENNDQTSTMIIEKNRHGAKGDVPVTWHKDCLRFEEAKTSLAADR